MRQLTFLFLTIFPFIVQAQEKLKSKPAKKTKHTLVGFILSPDYAYRTLQSDGTTSANTVISSRNKREVAKPGYTAGFNICFLTGTRFSIETGIQYSDKGYKTKMMDFVYAQPTPNLPTRGKLITGLSYLDIPAKINVNFGEKRLRFSAGAGLAINILLKETATSVMYFDNGDKMRRIDPTHNNFKKLNLSPFVSAGFDYRLNNKSSLKIEPTFRYGLLKIKDAPVSEKTWNAGLAIGYYVKLK